ncbi:MAG TPA: hypothetical protein VJ724_08450, partial [Tahibacter sp.]|nr:hypothetical protein [Tahibacter sp.]
MRRLVFAAALLAPSWSPDAAAAAPPTQVQNLSRTDVRRAPPTAATSPFLYAVLPAEQDVALVHYAGNVRLDANPDDLDRTRAQLTPCDGNAAIAAECAVARNLQARWFRSDAIDARIWYSRDLQGHPQCYSLDGARCVMTPVANPPQVHHVTDATTLRLLGFSNGLAALFASNAVVSMNTRNAEWATQITLPAGVADGSTFRLTVDATLPVAVNGTMRQPGSSGAWVYSAGAWRGDDFDPNVEAYRLAAVPARCGANDATYAWCAPLRALERTYHDYNVAEVIEHKRALTDTLFQQYEDWSVAKVETDNNYPARLSQLASAIDAKANEASDACSNSGQVGSIGASMLCQRYTSELDDLLNQRKALQAERDARLAVARTSVAEKRARQRHRLHETWSASDTTHFAALLKEESKELDELRQLKADYDKTADAQHQAYVDAVEQYHRDVSPLSLFEHFPLVGPEIRHIEEYIRNPSTKNLRRMLLGAAGPVGEAVEGVVELTTDEVASSTGELRFLRDMLSSLSGNNDFTSTMEEVVGDAIRDLGDEAIEGLRQVGLLTDRANKEGDGNETQTVAYASIVDLRANAQPAAYDPWTAGGPLAQAFRNKFTPRTPGIVGYMVAPESYDRSTPANVERAADGVAFEHTLDALFAHAMGKDYHRVNE